MTNKKQINPRRPIPASGYDRLRENLSSNFRQDTERFPEPQGFPMNEFPLPDNRANINRGRITTRKDDLVRDASIGLQDHDEAVMYYFNNVIKPSVIINGNRTNVPVIYGFPVTIPTFFNTISFKHNKRCLNFTFFISIVSIFLNSFPSFRGTINYRYICSISIYYY